MKMTETADYRFVTKEASDGTVSVMLEQWKGELSILRQGFLSFGLPKGTKLAEAREFANKLNDTIASLSYTEVPDWK
jgi:hypothetical protein